jgi:sulfur relay protein TusB/DsrH
MLIILSKAQSVNGYDSILKIAEKAGEKEEKVAILHIQDACIVATLDKYCERLAEGRIDAYVLSSDCEARGLLEKVGRNVKIVDYKGWVRLVMKEHDKIVSWT